ncbi:EamA family transporter [Actinoallomurus sp. NPDC050550]|uniref:EamA family transporter n=1 Tax=Actinoallomurus sp. NPDC050550 TaxID=3154937 RepID=UPI0033E4D613
MLLVPALWGGFPRKVVRSGRVWASIAVLSAATFTINYFYGAASALVVLAVLYASLTAGLVMTPAFIEWRKGPKIFLWPIVALMGVVLLVRPWEGAWNLEGVVFSALAGTGIALRIVVTKWIRRFEEDAPTDERLSTFEAVFARGVSALVGGLLLVLFAFLREKNHPQLSGWVILIVVVAGIANTAIPTLAEVVAIRVKLDPVAISTMYAVTPVVALVFTCAGQHRWPTLVELGATALVVVGAAGAASMDRDASAVLSERESFIEADTPPGHDVSKAPAPLRGARGRRRGMERPPSWAKAQGRGNKKNKTNAGRRGK